MRIGCLQFAPQLGDIDNNLNRADAVLSRHEPEDLDLLVLPELAFTGKSLCDAVAYSLQQTLCDIVNTISASFTVFNPC